MKNILFYLLLTILLVVSPISCATGSNSSSNTDSESLSNTFSNVDSSSADNTARTIDRNNQVSEESSGSITQNESREDQGTSSGVGTSSARYVIEYVDDQGNVERRSIVELSADSVTTSDSSSEDSRSQGGSYSGNSSDSSEISTSNSSSRVNNSAAEIDSSTEESSSTDTESSSYAGMSVWFWLLLGFLAVLGVGVFIYNRSLLGRISRFTTFLGSMPMKTDDANMYQAMLNAKDRELIRKRRND